MARGAATSTASARPRAPRSPVAVGGASSSTVLRAITVLECVAHAERAVALGDVVAITRLARPTAHRILTGLERHGLLQREGEGKGYTVGARLSALAIEAMRSASRRGPRHAILQALVDEVGETCNLTTLVGNEVVYLDRVEAHWPLRLVLQPGSRVPIHCTASGKLFLATMPAQRRRRLLHAAPLKRWTDNTITHPARLQKALQRIEADRVGTDDEEFLAGLTAVAVPVSDRAGRVWAAIAVHAPTARMTMERARRHVPALRRAAAAIGAAAPTEER